MDTKVASEKYPEDCWTFRPSTLDRAIFNGVVLFNEYRLPAVFAPDDIVVDVGAHIGSFARAVLSRGCENVFSFEPDRENCALATRNLAPFIERGLVRLLCGAVWRSDPNDDELRFDGYHPFPKSFAGMEGIINTGCGSVIWGEGEIVTKLSFDDIVDSVTDNGTKRIRLLKLDCEGAEWPILFTSHRLRLIDQICGEFHEIGGEYLEISEGRQFNEPPFSLEMPGKFTAECLSRFLSDSGFTVTYSRHQRPTGETEGLGLFFATRDEASTCFGAERIE
jgi:FkbM family methyltransferase